MKKIACLCLFISLLIISCKNSVSSTEPPIELTFEPQDYFQVDEANALKGFFPIMTSNPLIPCSMEFFNIDLKDIMTGENSYNFTELNKKIQQINNRGRQAVFRVVLDTPGEYNDNDNYISGTPDFFWSKGIQKIYYYPDRNTSKPQCYFPDYTDQKCINILDKVIRKLGSEYDGKPGVGFIFCGFIGHWGEWHNYYDTSDEDHHMPTDTQQRQLYKAFAESFTKTITMTRYPTSSCLQNYPNIGFHDDSFTESTVNDSISWYFYSRLKSQDVTDRWKTAVISGEFRPENQKPFIEGTKYEDYYQDYDLCIQKTHCSNLIFNKAFNSTYVNDSTKRNRVWTASKKLGYDLYCSNIGSGVQGNKIKIQLHITNTGIAPFYYN
jgi:hypothetical protein